MWYYLLWRVDAYMCGGTLVLRLPLASFISRMHLHKHEFTIYIVDNMFKRVLVVCITCVNVEVRPCAKENSR